MDLSSIGSETTRISLSITGFRMLVHHLQENNMKKIFNYAYRSMLAVDGMVRYIRA
jgi:hypothetical protein